MEKLRETLTPLWRECAIRNEEKTKKLESAIRSALEIKSLWLPPMDKYRGEQDNGEYSALYAMEANFKELIGEHHANSK